MMKRTCLEWNRSLRCLAIFGLLVGQPACMKGRKDGSQDGSTSVTMSVNGLEKLQPITDYSLAVKVYNLKDLNAERPAEPAINLTDLDLTKEIVIAKDLTTGPKEFEIAIIKLQATEEYKGTVRYTVTTGPQKIKEPVILKPLQKKDDEIQDFEVNLRLAVKGASGPTNEGYETLIKPILTTYKCLTCHKPGAVGKSVLLDRFPFTSSKEDLPNNTAAILERLLKSIKQEDGALPMPDPIFNLKVSTAEIKVIEDWSKTPATDLTGLQIKKVSLAWELSEVAQSGVIELVAKGDNVYSVVLPKLVVGKKLSGKVTVTDINDGILLNGEILSANPELTKGIKSVDLGVAVIDVKDPAVSIDVIISN